MDLHEQLMERRKELAAEIRKINDSDISPEEKSNKTYFLDREMEEVEDQIATIELHNEKYW